MRKIFTLCSLVCLCFNQMQAQAPIATVTGNLVGNVNWSNDSIYLLQGKVYVKAGATLTIEPGTVIKGDKTVAGSALIVTRGAKIYAIGTAEQPIVFTSSETPGNRATADWGGVIISGNARLNVSGGEGTLEGGNLSNPDGTVSDGKYGGLNDLDNSGELRYVRIEYAGYAYAANNELNSLTLAAVGSGTKLSYIQCSYGFDDAFEFFGGTVDADHLISFRGNDDDFDTDFGYRGHIQFGVSMRDTAVADPVSKANGFESDNDAAGSGNMPYTSPVFSNMTMVGPKQNPTTTTSTYFNAGAHIRRNSHLSLFNSIIMGFPIGVKIDGDSCHANADAGTLTVKNNMMSACTLSLDSTAGGTWNITPWFTASANANSIYPNNSDIMLTAPFNYLTPDFKPATGSPALTGADFTDAKLATGFTTVTYRGAFGNTDWTSGWANFNPDTVSYTNGIFPTSTSTIKVSETTMQLYPNPASQQVNIRYHATTSETIHVSIIGLDGKVITTEKQFQKQGENVFTLNTSNLSKGFYFVQVQGSNFNKTLRLSIK